MISAIAWLLVLLSALSLGGVARAIRRRRMHVWLPSYVARVVSQKPRASAGPVDVLFCLVDHFEPGWSGADAATAAARVDGWVDRYPRLAVEFRDFDGFVPRHTWFYPPHYFDAENMNKLVQLCMSGFGEIEMHLHHNRMEPWPDTSETLRQKIQTCIDLYSQFGIFQTGTREGNSVRYGFIHGDWALDNSRPEHCGVNDEITILKETGCYADFTFPAYMMDAQPRMANAIYYASDDPERPKSYDRGRPMKVGGTQDGDLLMIQGPLGLRWRGARWPLVPKVDDGEISADNPPSKARVDFWVRTGIHVVSRPEWVVVKAFTHGADTREQDLLGEPIRRMHRHLQTAYNDGARYRLHYVTARELHNILRAAEAGKTGNAGEYRDFVLKPYSYRCVLPGETGGFDG